MKRVAHLQFLPKSLMNSMNCCDEWDSLHIQRGKRKKTASLQIHIVFPEPTKFSWVCVLCSSISKSNSSAQTFYSSLQKPNNGCVKRTSIKTDFLLTMIFDFHLLFPVVQLSLRLFDSATRFFSLSISFFFCICAVFLSLNMKNVQIKQTHAYTHRHTKSSVCRLFNFIVVEDFWALAKAVAIVYLFKIMFDLHLSNNRICFQTAFVLSFSSKRTHHIDPNKSIADRICDWKSVLPLLSNIRLKMSHDLRLSWHNKVVFLMLFSCTYTHRDTGVSFSGTKPFARKTIRRRVPFECYRDGVNTSERKLTSDVNKLNVFFSLGTTNIPQKMSQMLI